jgi:hypothetical protein
MENIDRKQQLLHYAHHMVFSVVSRLMKHTFANFLLD